MTIRPKKPDSWMPLYIADYLADTAHLSTEQHGAYLLLLMAAWRRGGSLPNCDSQLAAIARMTETAWRKTRAVILEFFSEEDDTLIQHRLVEEYAQAVVLYGARVNNGKKGGRPKKAKPEETENKPIGYVSLNPSGSPAETQPQPHFLTEIKPLSPAHDSRLDDPGLSDYHRTDWQPDLQQLTSMLARSGCAMPEAASLADSLNRFNLNFTGRALTPGETYSRLVRWICEDVQHEKSRQARIGNSGSRPVGFAAGDANVDQWAAGEQGREQSGHSFG